MSSHECLHPICEVSGPRESESLGVPIVCVCPRPPPLPVPFFGCWASPSETVVWTDKCRDAVSSSALSVSPRRSSEEVIIPAQIAAAARRREEEGAQEEQPDPSEEVEPRASSRPIVNKRGCGCCWADHTGRATRFLLFAGGAKDQLFSASNLRDCFFLLLRACLLAH